MGEVEDSNYADDNKPHASLSPIYPRKKLRFSPLLSHLHTPLHSTGMFKENELHQTVFTRGFPVGFHTGQSKKSSKHYLYNHVRILIQYHDDKGSETLGADASATKVRNNY